MALIPINEPMATSDYFETTSFRNCIDASIIAVWNHFSSMLFKDDSTRIVYASSDFAFRKREQEQQKRENPSGNLDLPFMNFRIDQGGLANQVDRKWFNHIANIRGVWIPELARNIRFTPVTLSFDSTLFVHKDIDAMFAVSELFWDDSNETQLRPVVVIDDCEVELPGNLGYNLNPYSQYSENDWLKENKMIAIQVNMTLETFIIKDNSNISIPQKVILDFAHGLNAPTDNPSEILEGIIDHDNAKVDWTF